MDTNLTHDSGLVTFILQMDVAGDTDEARAWVAERSVKTVLENNEDGTRRFEWFLTKDSTKAVLIEQFNGSAAAKIRVENLFASPVSAEWQERFTPTAFLVCGSVKSDLVELLEPLNPQYLGFEAGFHR